MFSQLFFRSGALARQLSARLRAPGHPPSRQHAPRAFAGTSMNVSILSPVRGFRRST
jgi:hypothetical protein